MCSPEYFRTPDNVMLPDRRCKHITIEQIYPELQALTLDQDPPAALTIEFETIKNLYLYTWFVYEFMHIADRQALLLLEKALKIRCAELTIPSKQKDGLWKLLLKAEQHDLIGSEDLPADLLRHASFQPQHLSKSIKKIIKQHLAGYQSSEQPASMEVENTRLEKMDQPLLNETISHLSAHPAALPAEENALLTVDFTILRLTCALINAMYAVH